MALSANAYTQDLIERTKQTVNHSNTVKLQLNKGNDNSSEYDVISPFTLNNKKSNSGFGEIYLDLNFSDLKSLRKKSKKKLLIPVAPKRYIHLLIEPVDLIHEGSKVIDAEDNVLEVQRGVFYRGKVNDDDNSTVSLSLFKKQIRVVISDQFGNYNLGLTESGDSYVIYNDKNLGPQPFDCKNDELSLDLPEKLKKEVKAEYLKNTNCVKIYVEADYTTYLNFGSDPQSVASFVEGAFNEVSTIYSNAGVSIQLSDIKVWTTPDPYGANNNVGGALTYINNNVSNFNGDLFHLVSATGNCCGWSGVGYVGYNTATGKFNGSTVCGSNPFAVSQTSLNYESLPAYSWTVNVLAHEMGHNMGSPHTHQCLWGANYDTPIDGCITPDASCVNPGLPVVGSVMSYCHTKPTVGISLANGFHPEVAAHIQQQYNNRTCLSSCVPIAGCTDEESHNYNPLATVSDDSCEGTCADGILNGDELAIDCGGSKCGICVEQCEETLLQLDITFDRYAEETSWEITDSQGNVVYAGGEYDHYGEGAVLSLSLCLSDGDYTFTMLDSYGDGMCCTYGNGSYKLGGLNGSELLSGDEFGRSESTSFVVKKNTCYDGILNGTEEEIDCGGDSCTPCNASLICPETILIESDHITDFEGQNDIWIQNTEDDFDFSIISGATPSANTGPLGAAAGDNYFYVESSSPNFPSKSAIINSKCLDINDLVAPEFSFDYHMNGEGMGSINVSIIDVLKDEEVVIWTINGHQGNQWHTAKIDLSSYQGDVIQIRLTATTGTNHTSDLALDNLSIMQSILNCGQESLTYNASDMNLTGQVNKVVRTTIRTESKIFVGSNSSLLWQAGESIEINGEFEISEGAEALFKTEECTNQ